MLSNSEGVIIYTTQDTASIGRLDPGAASYTTFTPTHEDILIEPSCSPIAPSSTGHLIKTRASFSWSSESYPLLDIADGWRIYGMPTGSDPWGVTALDYAYVVDPGTSVGAGRNILSRFLYQLDNTYLPLLSKQ